MMTAETNEKTFTRTRILLIDSHPLLLRGVASFIRKDERLEVCGMTSSGRSAPHLVFKLKPDRVVMEIALQDTSGLQLIETLCSRCPGLPILVYSAYREEVYAERALQAGARGYMMKDAEPEDILDALRRIGRGEIWVSERITGRMLDRCIQKKQINRGPATDKLSNRELEVFMLIGQGASTRQIAERLHLSVKTIHSHRARLKSKLGVCNGNELAQHAMRWVYEQEVWNARPSSVATGDKPAPEEPISAFPARDPHGSDFQLSAKEKVTSIR